MRNPWFTYTVRQCVEGDAFPQTSPLTEHARSCQHPAQNNSDFQPQGHAESWWTIGTGTGHHYATLQKITERTQYNALQCTLIPRSRSVLDQLAFGRPTCWNSPESLRSAQLLASFHSQLDLITWPDYWSDYLTCLQLGFCVPSVDALCIKHRLYRSY